MYIQSYVQTMTNNRVFKHIENVIKDINEQVNDLDIDEPDAKEIISNMVKQGGGINVPDSDEFIPVKEPVRDVVSRIDSEYSLAFGIDGSTTKDLSFNNGLIISVALASMCVTGGRRSSSESETNLNSKNTVSIATHFDDKTIDIQPNSTEQTKVYYNQFPSVDENSAEIPNWITNIARTQAEGSHFRQISNKVDGPIFLDGPLLPPGILIWLLYDQVGESEGKPTEYKSDLIADILQNYVDGLHNCVLNSNPVFGVQKTTSSNRVLNALIEKGVEESDLVWTNDGTLFNSALDSESDDNDAIISYTPWYVENKYDIGGRHGLITPLEDYDKVDLPEPFEESYRKRAFFFAKPPTESTVYRVGIPEAMYLYTDYTKSELRDIALNEMISQFREPLPIVVADEKVRIPRHIRSKFRKLINSKSHIGKNEQRFGDQNE